MSDYQYAMRFFKANQALNHLSEVVPNFLVFKGVAWALYQGNLARIGPGDLDVWVPQDFTYFACELANHPQFTCEIPLPVRHMDKITALQFVHLPSRLIIDFHQKLFRPYLPKKMAAQLDATAWRQRVTLKKDSIQVNTLPKSIAALYALFHAEKHHWAFKKDLNDVAFFLPHLSEQFKKYTAKPLQSYRYMVRASHAVSPGAKPFLNLVLQYGNHPEIHAINGRLLRYYLASSRSWSLGWKRFLAKINLLMVYDFYQYRHWPWVLKSFLPFLFHVGLLKRQPNKQWLHQVKQQAVEA